MHCDLEQQLCVAREELSKARADHTITKETRLKEMNKLAEEIANRIKLWKDLTTAQDELARVRQEYAANRNSYEDIVTEVRATELERTQLGQEKAALESETGVFDAEITMISRSRGTGETSN